MTDTRPEPRDPRAVTPTRPGDVVDAARTFARVAGKLTGEAISPRLGRYFLLEALGRGAMGTVHAAYDPTLDRKVALKIEHRLGEASARRERALAEARALAKLAHPNVVSVHEVGLEGDSIYIAMEFIDGQDLSAWVARDDPPMAARWHALRQCAAGLEAAHKAGLVHGDVKPSNVLRNADGRVVLVDFGLARDPEPMASGRHETEGAREGDRIDGTTHRHFGGTPAYCAPEQHADRELTARSDQFAFAASAWELLTGSRAFEGEDADALARAKADGLRVERGGMSRRTSAAFRRALDPDPQRRFASVSAFIEAAAPRVRSGGAGLLALTGAVVVAGIWAADRPDAAAPPVDPCAEVQAPAHEIWSDARRAELEGRAKANAGTWREEAWTHIGERLELATRRWGELRREVCEVSATPNFSPKLRAHYDECERRTLLLLEEVAKVVDEAKEPRAVTVELDRLALIELCSLGRRGLLEARASTLQQAGISAEQGREATARVDELTDRARELWFAGKRAEARALLPELEAALGQGASAFYEVEAHRTVGIMHAEPAQAQLHLWRAVELGMAERVDHIVLIAASDLASQLGSDPQTIASAVGVLRMVRNWAAAIEAGDDSGHVATVLAPFLGRIENMLGFIESDLGHNAQAAEHYRRSEQFARTQIALRPNRVVFPIFNLAELARAEDRFDEALEFTDQALEIVQAYRPQAHSFWRVVATSKVETLAAAGRLGEAQRALDALVRHRDEHSPDEALPPGFGPIAVSIAWQSGDLELTQAHLDAWEARRAKSNKPEEARVAWQRRLWSARSALAAEPTKSAKAAYAEVRKVADEVEAKETFVLARLVLLDMAAQIAVEQGAHDDATRWLEQAQAALDGLDSPSRLAAADHALLKVEVGAATSNAALLDEGWRAWKELRGALPERHPLLARAELLDLRASISSTEGPTQRRGAAEALARRFEGRLDPLARRELEAWLQAE